MSAARLEALPDGARLWIFGAHRTVEEGEARRLEERTRPFLDEWTAHRRELRAAFGLLERRFLAVAVDESRTPASGCSIDALMGHVRSLEEELGVRFLDGTLVWYRAAAGRIASVNREEFRRLGRDGDVDGRTRVFDLTLGRLGELRAGRLEVAAEESWHARLLPDRAGSSAGPARG